MVPEVGSVWKARDGRIMRVEEIGIPVLPSDMPWAKLTVINPEKGMRKTTTMGTANFNPHAFLQPYAIPK